MTIYLYVKTHKLGLKYFGKTINQDPHKYKGSGTYWTRFCEKYGWEYDTEIVAEFDESQKEQALQFSIDYSKTNNIVESSEWANLKEERLDGGFDHINGKDKQFYIEKAKTTVNSWDSEKTARVNAMKRNLGNTNGMYGRNRSGELNPRWKVPHTEESKKLMSLKATGRIASESSRKKMSEAQRKKWTNEMRLKRSLEYKSKGHRPPSSKGMLWWNDGSIERRGKVSPGENWNRGRLPKRTS